MANDDGVCEELKELAKLLVLTVWIGSWVSAMLLLIV